MTGELMDLKTNRKVDDMALTIWHCCIRFLSRNLEVPLQTWPVEQ